MALKLGEKVMLGITVLVAVAAVGKAIVQARATGPAPVRDFYEWTEAGLKGQARYGELGCNNCHRAIATGEIGHAPVLDGEGTRRTRDWLVRYFENPTELVPGSAHDGRWGDDFRGLAGADRHVLVEFLFGMKAGPGSPNYRITPNAAARPGS
jgi:cbb3-type cytochrome oxidase cytochrome c subunit